MTSIEIDEYFQTSLANNLSTLLDRIINGKNVINLNFTFNRFDFQFEFLRSY